VNRYVYEIPVIGYQKVIIDADTREEAQALAYKVQFVGTSEDEEDRVSWGDLDTEVDHSTQTRFPEFIAEYQR
jgi:hypothetical protein